MERKTKKCKICNQEIEVDDGELCFNCRNIENQVKNLEEGLNIIISLSLKTKKQIKLNWQYKK